MSKLINFGDCHFSSIQPWTEKAGEHFIEWFDKQDFGPKEEVEFTFAGDISERDVNPGNVIDQMYRFFGMVSKKGKHAYICIGNHDKKLYHDVEQHCLKFLSNYPNITVCEKEEILTTKNGYKVLMLPFQRFEDKNLHEYYTNNLPEKFYQESYDLVVGHWQIAAEFGPKWAKDGVDITKFNSKSFSIGHIHLRERPEYIGSIFPNNVKEQNDSYPRGYKVYENGVETFVKMPRFLKYVSVPYGEPIPPEEPNCAYTYTITNCNSEGDAKEKYPTVAVRTIEVPVNSIRNIGEIVAETSDAENLATGCNLNIEEELQNMIKENGIVLSRTTSALIKKAIKQS